MRSGNWAKSGVTIKKNEYDEFEVRLARQSSIYYTEDLEDAVDTGLKIAEEVE